MQAASEDRQPGCAESGGTRQTITLTVNPVGGTVIAGFLTSWGIMPGGRLSRTLPAEFWTGQITGRFGPPTGEGE